MVGRPPKETHYKKSKIYKKDKNSKYQDQSTVSVSYRKKKQKVQKDLPIVTKDQIRSRIDSYHKIQRLQLNHKDLLVKKYNILQSIIEKFQDNVITSQQKNIRTKMQNLGRLLILILPFCKNKLQLQEYIDENQMTQKKCAALKHLQKLDLVALSNDLIHLNEKQLIFK